MKALFITKQQAEKWIRENGYEQYEPEDHGEAPQRIHCDCGVCGCIHFKAPYYETAVVTYCTKCGEKTADGHKVTRVHGDWYVLDDGSICHTSGDYDIDGYRLTEPQWLEHMRDKDWVNMHDFLNAYLDALSGQKIKEVTIRIY